MAQQGGPRLLEVPAANMSVTVRFDDRGKRAPLLVYGHGAGAGIDHPATAGMAEALAERGVSVLRYQFPFMERKGGKGFGRDALGIAIATVAAACELGRRLASEAILHAGGHSYGGRMTTHAAAGGLLPDVTSLLLLGFPLHGAGKPDRARAAHLDQVPMPMCFVSGARDAMAQMPLLEEVVRGLSHARLHRIEGADHGFKAPKRVWPGGALDAVADQAAECLLRQD